ncbi:MAG: N-acyl homoserine lactonase family protein [Granulosicoccus sp.]|nr:N-acyl homoserine lactonase family protein [Granulosicoccus sp.]
MNTEWEVYAIKYADRNSRIRADSFIFDDNHDAPHPMDYFIWVLRNGEQTIVVDTGYDEAEGKRRDRPVLRAPATALLDMGIRAEEVDTLILTHLHYDHAGTVPAFPNARIYLQETEMVYATGPCMCHGTLQMPFTADHVCDMVRRVYDGKVHYLDGDGEVADGVTLHRIGGHSRGLQAVRVRTSSGWLCLASDAAHYYENAFARKPFPIVVDLEEMLRGFDILEALASDKSLIIPGHDPLITQHFPTHGSADFIFRLDAGPSTPLNILS